MHGLAGLSVEKHGTLISNVPLSGDPRLIVTVYTAQPIVVLALSVSCHSRPGSLCAMAIWSKPVLFFDSTLERSLLDRLLVDFQGTCDHRRSALVSEIRTTQFDVCLAAVRCWLPNRRFALLSLLKVTPTLSRSSDPSIAPVVEAQQLMMIVAIVRRVCLAVKLDEMVSLSLKLGYSPCLTPESKTSLSCSYS